MTDHHYSGDGFSRQSRLGATRRGRPTTTDMMGMIIVLLIFLLAFVTAYGASMENNAAYHEQQNVNAAHCLELFQLTENVEYANKAREALLFDNATCR